MKLATKILIAVFIIIGAGFYILTNGILKDVRIRYLEGVEEVLVDQARLLSSFISNDMEQNSFSAKELHKIFDNTYNMKFTSNIYQIKKTNVDIRVYITDTNGKIIFDSLRKTALGADFSKWRDVYLTLNGMYGARSSRDKSETQESSVLYVAAPVMVKGQIAGVLTVAKPTTNINNFLEMARSRIKNQSLIVVSLVILISILIIMHITKPIKVLTRYANDISLGKKTEFPRLDNSEIGDMGRAFENMREALENRKYVEKYVQTLTHEIKSPVSAIKGAAELLEEEMPQNQRKRFIENIQTESNRIKMLVDRMLELASIENMKSLKVVEIICFADLVKEVIEWINPVLKNRQLKLTTEIDESINIKADSFLIKQAMLNLIQNSADFSLKGDTILVSAKLLNNDLIVKVQDQGPGIPKYAKEKIFDRFFSLQRPDSVKKSTGLGLNFVKEIAQLHTGTIDLVNLSQEGGACATLTLPIKTII